MQYCITMERTLLLSVQFEAKNDDEALARAEQIYYGTKTDEFEEGNESTDYALSDAEGRTLMDWS